MSYALYVGKNRTADGVAYLAGYGDEPSSHWLELVDRQQHQAGATITVGVTPGADLPGQLTEIPQIEETARHIRVSYSYYKGLPAPLTNGGLNDHGVAVRDVWSPSRPELIAMTPETQTGPNYSEFARLVLERARTARQGVDLIGDLISRYGESTYGGNSHLIADSTEAWVMVQFAGGLGLWAAERLNADSIRVSRPGYIGAVPVNDVDHPDFLWSTNLVSFAVSQGWYNPDVDQTFDVNAIYGDGKLRWAGAAWIEEAMRSRAERPEKILFEDVIWALRTPRLTGDTAGYGQIVPLKNPGFDELRLVWHAQVGALAAPFVPIFMGVQTVPEEYRQHRYLTAGESARFVVPGHESDQRSVVAPDIESTRSATATFKRLLYLALKHEDPFLDEVMAAWTALERRLRVTTDTCVDTARILLKAGAPDLARSYLTYVTGTELANALQAARSMADGLEARTRLLHGFDAEPGGRPTKQIW